MARRPQAPPPSPEQVRKKMLGQALIDRVLELSHPLTEPAISRLESLWLEAIARPGVSKTAERLSELKLPRPVLDRVIAAWVNAYDVDMDAAELPASAYPTLDAFFTRRLKPGLRPIDPRPDVLVSPADSVLKELGPVDASARIPEVKGRTYSVAELFGDAVAYLDPADFIGGTYGVYYLSPRDYHRVHAPCDATVLAVRPQAGATYPVNALGVRKVEGLFVRNKRTVFALDTAFGRVGLVMVGATNVGRITSAVSAGDRIAKGAELGTFHLGSTVVLVTPRAANLAYLGVHQGEVVKVGQAVLARD